MLNANEPKRYTPNEVLVLFRAISKHLKTMPEAFQAQGVFRISGAERHILQIVNDILRHKKFVHAEYSVHDYVGALKYALINSHLLSIEDPAIQALKAKIAADDIAIGQSAVREFIETLAGSDDKTHFMVAEIFYEFLHQLTDTLAFQDKNKMSSVNLGIIAGPFFTTLIEDDPKQLLDTTFKFNQISAALISSEEFKQNFESRFPKAVEMWRERELIELESKRFHFLRHKDKHSISASSAQEESTLDKKKLKHRELQVDESIESSQPKSTRKLFSFRKKPTATLADDDGDSSLLSKLHLRRKKKY